METKIAKLWEIRFSSLNGREKGDAQRAAALIRSGQVETNYGKSLVNGMSLRVKACVL
jgi:hypothetical protein